MTHRAKAELDYLAYQRGEASNFLPVAIDRGNPAAARARDRAQRRREYQRAYYRKNAKRINRQTVERRRRKRKAAIGDHDLA